MLTAHPQAPTRPRQWSVDRHRGGSRRHDHHAVRRRGRRGPPARRRCSQPVEQPVARVHPRDGDHRQHVDVRHAPVEQVRPRRRRDLRLPRARRHERLPARQQSRERARVLVRGQLGHRSRTNRRPRDRRAVHDERHGRRDRPERRRVDSKDASDLTTDAVAAANRFAVVSGAGALGANRRCHRGGESGGRRHLHRHVQQQHLELRSGRDGRRYRRRRGRRHARGRQPDRQRHDPRLGRRGGGPSVPPDRHLLSRPRCSGAPPWGGAPGHGRRMVARPASPPVSRCAVRASAAARRQPGVHARSRAGERMTRRGGLRIEGDVCRVLALRSRVSVDARDVVPDTCGRTSVASRWTADPAHPSSVRRPLSPQRLQFAA